MALSTPDRYVFSSSSREFEVRKLCSPSESRYPPERVTARHAITADESPLLLMTYRTACKEHTVVLVDAAAGGQHL